MVLVVGGKCQYPEADWARGQEKERLSLVNKVRILLSVIASDVTSVLHLTSLVFLRFKSQF